MNFIIDYLYTIFLPLLILFFSIVTYNFYAQSKIKRIRKKELALVYNELETEKALYRKYKNNDTITQSLEDKTQSKLLKIRIDLLNIDFTYQEICKFI